MKMPVKCIFFFLLMSSFFFNSDAQIITTIAGCDDTALGDGGPALNAYLEGPLAIAFDKAGNLYITDGFHDRIRKINTAGIITTIAGTGTSGYNGDGIPAISAQVSRPTGIICDLKGNLYFCDNYNNRVRKIDTAGIITTIAGNGSIVYNGDNIPADTAAVYSPHWVAKDAQGDLYVSEWGNHRVRKMDTSGIITTIAGTGISGYTGDGGPAANAMVNSPYGIAIDDTGNIYFADYLENVVRKIDPSGMITTFAGNSTVFTLGDNGPATSAGMNHPIGVMVDGNGNVYITDASHECIRKVTAGIITTIAGNGTESFSGDGGPATAAELNNPAGITMDTAGTIYFTDFSNNRVRRLGWPAAIELQSANADEIVLYPNPVTSTLHIRSSVLVYQATILTLWGQVVWQSTSIPSLSSIDVSDLQPGVYLVRINNTYVRQFVKS